MGYRRVRYGMRGMGAACVVGSIDPVSGDTIAYCPPTDTTSMLTALGQQIANIGSQVGIPASTATPGTLLGMSTTTWLLIGGAVVLLGVMGGGRR
jgi:hypothetical protein